jgi:hypothetical protein
VSSSSFLSDRFFFFFLTWQQHGWTLWTLLFPNQVWCWTTFKFLFSFQIKTFSDFVFFCFFKFRKRRWRTCNFVRRENFTWRLRQSFNREDIQQVRQQCQQEEEIEKRIKNVLFTFTFFSILKRDKFWTYLLYTRTFRKKWMLNKNSIHLKKIKLFNILF